jgi:ankyrin repeat protein
LLENGADVDLKAHDGSTPLYRACLSGSIDIMGTILTAAKKKHSEKFWPNYISMPYDIIDLTPLSNASRSAKAMSQKSTLLHVAVQVESLPIIQKLIQEGAHTHVKDEDGHTPLDLAKQAFANSTKDRSFSKLASDRQRSLTEIIHYLEGYSTTRK